METKEIKKIIEALLFVSDRPLTTREIKNIVKDSLSENDNIENILNEMQQEYSEFLDRAFELKFVADGWTFATKPEFSPWIKILLKDKTTVKLSASAMEVLAIIAYKQPITRAEIDSIRGVDSGGVMDTLLDRKLIKIVGKKETLGRPMLYGTTQDFLRHFGLSHLSELPVIENASEIIKPSEEKGQELPFEGDTSQEAASEISEETPVIEEIENKVITEPSEVIAEPEPSDPENQNM